MNGDAKKRYKDIELPFMCPLTKMIFNSTKGISVYVSKTLKIDHSTYYDKQVIRYDKINKKHYRYDYVDFTNKKVIEFNGDFWHCNPEKYIECHIHRIMNKSAKELWNSDKIKSDWIKKKRV